MIRTKKRYVVNFPAHLADCEFNYRRLQRLMSGWQVNSTLHTADPSSSETSETSENSAWRFIVGKSKGTEIAVVMKVSESAKYTTTVQIAVYPNLQNHYSWSRYIESITENQTSKTNKFEKSKKDAVVTDDCLKVQDLKALLKRLGVYSIQVRLYHDATVAEVIGWEGQRKFEARNDYPNKKMYQTDEKAQLNRFLGELLERCLTDGRILDEIAIIKE